MALGERKWQTCLGFESCQSDQDRETFRSEQVVLYEQPNNLIVLNEGFSGCWSVNNYITIRFSVYLIKNLIT
jgi:hypothetical protein